VLTVVLLTVFAVFAYQRSLAGVARAGSAAPPFQLRDTAGAKRRLADYHGRVVLLDFWASWCTVCAQGAPALAAFATRYAERVAVVGIDWREPEATLARTAAAWGLGFTNLRDGDGLVATRYGLTGVPEDWWVGAAGQARLHTSGGRTFEQYQADFRAATGTAIDGPGIPPVLAGRAAALAAGADRLWMGVAGGAAPGLWSRPQQGGAWARAPLPGAIVAIAAAGRTLLVAGPAGQLMGSSDGGARWAAVPLAAPAVALAVAPGPTPVWYAWARGRLWASTDWAAGFRPVSAGPRLPAPATVTGVAAAGPNIYLTTAAGAFRSADGGRTWRAAGLMQQPLTAGEFSSPTALVTGQQPLAAAGVVVTAGGTATLAGADGLYQEPSAGGGGGRLATAPARAFAAVAIAPDGAVWAAAVNGDLYRSTAGGTRWEREGAG